MTRIFLISGWIISLHLRRWSMYRADVCMWILTIWATLAMQAVVILTIFRAVHGDVFGYSPRELVLFFGITILSTGIAQSVIHGVVLHLSRAVHTGQFDYWLLHPIPLFWRFLLEDIGIVWFWPHIIVGIVLVGVFAAPSLWLLAAMTAILAAVIEMSVVVTLSSFAIQWTMWNPDAFLWDYMEQARSIPILRAKSLSLMTVSFGVLQYSLALEVLTNKLSLLVMVVIATCAVMLAFLSIWWNVRYYTSAST